MFIKINKERKIDTDKNQHMGIKLIEDSNRVIRTISMYQSDIQKMMDNFKK